MNKRDRMDANWDELYDVLTELGVNMEPFGLLELMDYRGDDSPRPTFALTRYDGEGNSGVPGFDPPVPAGEMGRLLQAALSVACLIREAQRREVTA